MSIDRLRAELEAVDRELLERVARRQRLAVEIGRAKRDAGQPARDYDQEREVLERARQIAGGLALAPELAERLLLELIDSSLAAQERESVAAGSQGSGKRALVIGGSGRMGRWFVEFLRSQGYAVEVADPSAPPPGVVHLRDWREAEPGHDLIVVAAPLRASNRVLTELAEDPPPGLIFDIGSLKAPLREGLDALVGAGARVSSLHPMFGPGTELLSGRHVIFIDLGVAGAVDEARGLFASTMAEQVQMDLDSHDRLIAWILGLSHALNIAFVSSLADSGEAAPLLERLSSTTFDQQLRIAGGVSRESPRLYYEIQALNGSGTEALDALARSVERLRRVVSSGDEEAFVAMMERGREYLTGLGRRTTGGPSRR